MTRLARALLKSLLLSAALVVPARAADSASASYRNSRSSVDSGGTRKTSASYRGDASNGAVSAPTANSASYSVRDGFMAVAFHPSRITDLWASSTTQTTEIYLQWTAPGNDGDENTTAGSFRIKYSSIIANSPALSNANFEAADAVPVAPPAPGPRGTRHTLTVTGLSGGVTYYFAIKAAERDGMLGPLSAGATAQTYANAPTGVAFSFVALSSVGVQYVPVGADGYVVTASTKADFSGVLYSSTTFGTQASLAPSGLDPNTTYYVKAGALWAGTTIYSPTVLSSSTLSKLAAGTTVYQINVTSMSVNWLPLPAAPPAASSNTSEGYVLEVSTRSDFAPLWTSSATPNVSLSTLAPGGLMGGVTYYFRVGSLNWNGVPNYAAAVSTLMPVQLGVELTTHTLSIPGLTSMNTTITITTSVIVSNTGNVLETYWIKAATITVGSPWQIAAAPAADRFSAWTVVNSTQAGAVDFVAADKLSDVEAACGATVFTMGNQNCVQVAPGQARTLWFKLAMPIVTSTIAPQDIRITARAVKDP